MGVTVTVSQTLRSQVRVDLGGAQRLMSQQLLNTSQVCAVVEQVGSKAVTQCVRADRRVKAYRTQVLVQLAPLRPLTEALPMLVQKQGSLWASVTGG